MRRPVGSAAGPASICIPSVLQRRQGRDGQGVENGRFWGFRSSSRFCRYNSRSGGCRPAPGRSRCQATAGRAILRANIDAAAEAKRFGIAPERAANYHCDEEGTALNYEVLSEAIREVRMSSKPLSANWKARIDADTGNKLSTIFKNEFGTEKFKKYCDEIRVEVRVIAV